MNVNRQTNCLFSKSLLRLAACTLLTTGISIGQLVAAPGSNVETMSQGVQQETVSIKGRVVDDKGEGLIGVSILEKGAGNGTISSADGSYTLKVKGLKPILVFSYIGSKTQEIVVGTSKTINVTLQEDSKLVDEVVVIGYGTQRKGDVTSAVTHVKSEDFTQGFTRDAADLVKGKVAGLNISNGSGNPTDKSNIMLRGVSSLKGSSTPLILINGVQGDLNTVAPEDIETVDVLKDASAAAIYGTRGANGVILITTKAGRRNMKAEVNYSAYAALSNFGRKADFVNADQMRNLMKQGVKFPYLDEGTSTDWLKEVIQTGFTQNHNVSIKGGSENSNYAASVTYNNQDGVFKNTNNQEMRASFDANQYFLKDKVKINLNFVKGFQRNNVVGEASSFNKSIYRQALIRNPTAPIRNTNGSWNETSLLQYYNPVAMIEETKGEQKNEWSRLTTNLTFRPIDAWETNLMLSTRRSDAMTGYSETKKHYSNTKNGKNGVASKSDEFKRSDNLELTSKYNMIIGKHNFSVMGGYSYEYNVTENLKASNYDFPSDAFSYDNLGSGYALQNGKATMESDKYASKLIGFFSRASYNFSDRYNVLASIRHEGSSKFGANYKWGNFPSVSAGWTLSNESFMKEIAFIDNLKVRTGYGTTGVIPNDSYQSLSRFKYEGSFFSNGKWIKGLVPASNNNDDFRWEKSTEINIGLDYSFLKSRIYGSIDVYSKKTTDMIWEYPVPQPPNLYGTTLANVGQMNNKGIEVVISAIPFKTKDFEWNSTLTLSHNENKLVSLSNDFYAIDGDFINTGDTGDPISLSTHRLEPGQSLGNFWGLKSVDITDDGQWIIETPQGERKTLAQADLTNDKIKQILGNGIPKVNVGWTNNFRYKNFDLGLVFNGAAGFQILNFQRMFYENANTKYIMLNSAFDKVYGKTVLKGQQTFISYYIENGDYIKLDNITLGYTWKLPKNNYVRSIRTYASGQNLFCITGYKGLDPEIDRSDIKSLGNDSRDKYPSVKTFTFGLNVTF